MKKGPKLIIAIVIIAALLLGGVYIVTGDTYFEEASPFGKWGQQILVNYASGAQESLSLVTTNPVKRMTVTHGSDTIVSVTYRMSAKASGTGYSSVSIDYSLYTVHFTTGSSVVPKTFSGSPGTIPLDNAWHVVCSATVTAAEIQDSLPSGSYTMNIAGQGTLKYKGNLDSTWTTAPNPSYVSFTVTITSTNTLVIDFSNDVTYVPEEPPQGQYEVFTTYYDGGSPYITDSVSSLTATNMPRQATSYYTRPISIGTQLFTVSFNITVTQLQQSPTVNGTGGSMCMMFENSNLTNQAQSQSAKTGMIFGVREYYNGVTMTHYNCFQVRSRTANAPTGDWEDFYSVVLGTPYHVIIQRTGLGTNGITWSIYTGWDGTTGTLVHTPWLIDDGGTNINYFVPLCARGDSSENPTLKSSGTISDVKIVIG